MTRRQSRIAAAQAVVVGVLLVVVFATLLRPNNTKPLFGVVAPDQAEPAGAAGAGGQIGATDNRRETRRRPSRERSDGGRATGATALAPAPGTAPGTALGEQGTAGLGGGEGDQPSPTDDQYTDTLSRLEARLD